MPESFIAQTAPAAVIRVTGEDAPGYLQSQFSNDLASLGSGQCRYGLWLDRKGHVQADSMLFVLDDEEYLLLSLYCPASELLAKLEENIIADDVELEDVTEGAILISELGLPAAEVPAIGAFERHGDGPSDSCSGLRFAGHRSRQPTRETLWLQGVPENAKSSANIDADWLRYERIEAGIPAVPTDIGPADLPQEGGLEKAAVSFNKGCYLGQEVMARLHAMGRVQRALHRVELDTLPEGMPLDVVNCEGKKAGELRSAASRDGHVLGLAMLKKRHLNTGAALTITTGEPVRVLDALD